MGALNSNVFATGRLCVAASKRNYLPRIFGDPICTTKEEEPVHYAKVLQGYPTALVSVLLRIRTLTEDMRWDKKVPVCVFMSHTHSHSQLCNLTKRKVDIGMLWS